MKLERAKLLQMDTEIRVTNGLSPARKKAALKLVKVESTTEEAPPDTERAFLLMSEKMKRLARNRAKQLGKNPDVYPEEPEAVNEFLGGVLKLWRGENVSFAKYLSRLAFSYLRGGMQGVDDFISTNLDILISNIRNGSVSDFDADWNIKSGDNALAFLAQCVASLAVVEKFTPKLVRKEYNFNGGGEESPDRGVTLFVCGYGATLRLYEKIFALMNTPVIAYQLPHDVISADPKDVRETFDLVYNKIYRGLEKDRHLEKITHIIGNSTGTMFATKLALRLSKEHRKENGPEGKKLNPLKLALVQTGTSWPEAMKRATGKFARQVRSVMSKDKKITWEMFKQATEGYNPIDRSEDLAQATNDGLLDLSIFAGLDDRNISPAKEVVEPLLQDLDSRKVNYHAYVSKKGGHHSTVLFFVWIAMHKMTEWGQIFENTETEKSGEKKSINVSKYHVRRATKEPAMA